MRLLLLLACILPTTFASPVDERAAQVSTANYCSPWDTVSASPYELLLNQWGISGATGSQCAHITSLKGTAISWAATFHWSGGSGVKSFTNTQLNHGVGKQLRAISSMHSSWNWTWSSTNITADVTYDLFTADTPTGPKVNEVMVWLANYNAGHLSSSAQYN